MSKPTIKVGFFLFVQFVASGEYDKSIFCFCLFLGSLRLAARSGRHLRQKMKTGSCLHKSGYILFLSILFVENP